MLIGEDQLFKKVNQHYIAQFWQRRFKDSNDKLWVRYSLSADPRDPRDPDRGKAFDTSTKKTLTENFTYTVVDRNYRPYDALENALSAAEGKIKENQTMVLDPSGAVTPDVVPTFCWGVAISTCRLPYVMAQAFRRRKPMAWAYADVQNTGEQEFIDRMATFGQIVSDEHYERLKNEPLESLIEQANYIENLSPLNPDMPEQDALAAVDMVALVFSTMDLTVLEVGGMPNLIIGDTPIRDSDLALGFTVPLSKTAAAQFSPAAGSTPQFARKQMTAADAQAINQQQYSDSVTHVIGSDPVYLDTLTS